MIPFLSLPPEIRNKIYDETLISKTQCLIGTVASDDWTYKGPRSLANYSEIKYGPSLLATCKQIHQEATPFLYAKNRIAFRDLVDDWGELGQDEIVELFVNAIGPANAALVRSVSLVVPRNKWHREWRHIFRDAQRALRLLRAGCPHLAAVRIAVASRERGPADVFWEAIGHLEAPFYNLANSYFAGGGGAVPELFVYAPEKDARIRLAQGKAVQGWTFDILAEDPWAVAETPRPEPVDVFTDYGGTQVQYFGAGL